MLEETGWSGEIATWQGEMLARIGDLSAMVSAFKLSAAAPTAPGGVSKAPPAPVGQGEQWILGITATVFGGGTDPNQSAYDGHEITDTEIGCSFPCHYPKPLPLVRIRNTATGRSLDNVSPVDVGPWNTRDDWLRAGRRPQAEQQHASHTIADDGRIPSNDAGIDLTPAAARALGIDGKGKVDVQLVTAAVASLASVPATLNHPIVWTQVIGTASTLLWIFTAGKFSVPPDWQAYIAAILVALTGGSTAAVHVSTAPSPPGLGPHFHGGPKGQ
jgi:hypothetical protein